MEGSKRVQYEAAFAVSLASMTTSAAFYWMIPVIPKFYNDGIGFSLTKSELSWVVAMTPLGGLFGSIIASSLSDKFGRKKTLLASAFGYVIGTILVMWPINVWVLNTGRLLWGCGTGMVVTVSSVYISEIADKSIRATLSAITRFMFSAGTLLMLSVGSFVSYKIFTSIMFILPVGYFIACCRIPESPYYLLKEGKKDQALKEYTRLCGCKDKKLVEEQITLLQSDVRKEMQHSSSYLELLTGKRYRKAIIVSLGLRVAQIMSGTIPVQQYLGHIIQESNSGMELSTTLVSFGVLRFIIGMATPFVVDRIGRRPLLICTYFASSVFLLTIGGYFYFQTSFDENSLWPLKHFVFIAILLITISSGLGYNTLVYIIPSEIFPLNVRSISATVFNILTSLLNFVVIKAYQPMEDWTGLQGVFTFYGIMALNGAIFSYFIVPETKGKALRDIQIELQGNFYEEAEVKLKEISVKENGDTNNEVKDLTTRK